MPNNTKEPKLKKCRNPACRTEFSPFQTTQKACSPTCALKLVEISKEKAARKELKEGRKKLKTKSEWLREAQRAFNRYIRVRDKDEPCISCGTIDPNIQYCAGHYLTRGGYPELRFDENNVHKQCNQYCNLQLSGNISKYRINLVEKIGISQVEWLEGKHEPKYYTIEQIQEIKKEYTKKAKELEE